MGVGAKARAIVNLLAASGGAGVDRVADLTSHVREKLDPTRLRACEGYVGIRALQGTAAARQRHRDGEAKGTEAETRRLRREMELQRLIQTGMLQDERSARVISTPTGGRVVENGSAYDYATRAEAAILAGDYEAASVLAEASIALGGPASAQGSLATASELLETPEQQEARKDLAKIDRAVAVLQREAWAAEATAYDYAAKTAEAIGDDHRNLAATAIRSGMKAKMAALRLADRDEYGQVIPGSYQQLEPALPKPADRSEPGAVVVGGTPSAGQVA